MSRLHTETFPCAKCAQPLSMGIVASINADRRPDLRGVVLDDSYQRGRCEACGTAFRAEPELTYLDGRRKQWILVQPARLLAQWPALEQNARDAFETAYGEQAPDDARELGEGMRARVTFGWAGFREKLLCAEHGLDDIALELLKFALLRSMDDVPLADDHALRLVAVRADELQLVWCLASGDLGIETIPVPRAVYDEIAADREGVWQPLRAELSAGPFVDMDRILAMAED